MSIPDTLMEQYFKLLTDISDKEWDSLSTRMEDGLNPSVVKKLLARIIVTFLHDEQIARNEQIKFEKTFAKKAVPNDIEEFCLAEHGGVTTHVDLLIATQLAKSKSDARRLVQAGAVRIIHNDKTIKLEDALSSIPEFDIWVLNVGKRRFMRIVRT